MADRKLAYDGDKYTSHTIEPRGYESMPIPPAPWRRVVNGYMVTPVMVCERLRECRDNKRDMTYIARKLGVGEYAVLAYAFNPAHVPATIAEKFVALFCPGRSLPEAPPKAEVKWTPEKPGRKPATPFARTPDFKSEEFAAAIIAAREKRGWTTTDVARELRHRTHNYVSTQNVAYAEKGQLKYKMSNGSMVYQLCELFELNARDYETKPRINFEQFQARLVAAKPDDLSWREVARQAGVSATLLGQFRLHEYAGVVYLTEQMQAVADVLGIDVSEFLEGGDEDLGKGRGRGRPSPTETPQIDAVKFAKDAFAAREKLGLTIQQMEKLSGLGHTTIVAAESGRMWSNQIRRKSVVSTVDKLCNFLGLNSRDYDLLPRMPIAELRARLDKARDRLNLSFSEINVKYDIDLCAMTSPTVYDGEIYITPQIESVLKELEEAAAAIVPEPPAEIPREVMDKALAGLVTAPEAVEVEEPEAEPEAAAEPEADPEPMEEAEVIPTPVAEPEAEPEPEKEEIMMEKADYEKAFEVVEKADYEKALEVMEQENERLKNELEACHGEHVKDLEIIRDLVRKLLIWQA